jgi:hypothetical protein
MPQDQLQALADAVANGTWKRSDTKLANPKQVAQVVVQVEQDDDSPLWERVFFITSLLRDGLAGDEAKLRKCAEYAFNMASILNDELSELI